MSPLLPQTKGSDVSKRAQRISSILNYQFPVWLLAAIVLALILGIKLLTS